MSKDTYLFDHYINGRLLYPAAGYMVLAWKSFAKTLDTDFLKISVIIEDFKIHSGSVLPKEGSVRYTTIITSKGHFEISEGGTVLAEGTIKEGNSTIEDIPWNPPNGDLNVLKRDEIYQELRIRGYDYGEKFRCLQAFNIKSK